MSFEKWRIERARDINRPWEHIPGWVVSPPGLNQLDRSNMNRDKQRQAEWVRGQGRRFKPGKNPADAFQKALNHPAKVEREMLRRAAAIELHKTMKGIR